MSMRDFVLAAELGDQEADGESYCNVCGEHVSPEDRCHECDAALTVDEIQLSAGLCAGCLALDMDI